MSTDGGKKLYTKSYLLRDLDLVSYTPMGKGKVVSAIHYALIPDLIALVYVMHRQPGVVCTLPLLCEHFYWPAVARYAQEHVLSCGCRRDWAERLDHMRPPRAG